MRETPLHCAARAGHYKIVESIISFTRLDSNELEAEAVLRAKNKDGGTALHEAIRNGHVKVAKLLMKVDPGLANMVDEKGISPLYLAAMAGSLPLIRAILSPPSTTTAPPPSTTTTAPPFTTTAAPPSTTTAPPPLPVSYAGPDGQTAMHAAAFHNNPEIAKKLLEWNQMLAKSADNSGSTPLHYAASAGNDEIAKLLLQKDYSLSYIADSSGIFPVHVAATRGYVSVIKQHTEHCPDSDELLDIKGRNFLHTAVENKRVAIVQYVCKSSRLAKLSFKLRGCPDSDELLDKKGRNLLLTAVQRGRIAIVRYVCQRQKLAKLMNASDFEGNTPLHLAVKKGDQEIVGLLMRDKRVNSSIMNKEGLTPLDLSVLGLESGLTYNLNPSYWILRCLEQSKALASPRRLDHFLRDNIARKDLKKESEKYQHINLLSVTISSVFIATVAFAAAFTLPGGYRADGTPVLAGKYLFKAFVIADTLAFVLSVVSTCWNSFRGSVLLHPSFRSNSIVFSSALLLLATRCMVVAFELVIYLVLSPVSKSIGIVVCVITSASLLVFTPNIMQKYKLAITIKSRVGWTGLFKSCALLRQHEGWMNNWLYSSITTDISFSILWDSLIYIFIFLLPLLT